MSAFLPLDQVLSGRREARLPAARVGGEVRALGELEARVAGLRAVLAPRPERRWLLATGNAWDFAVGLLALWAEGRVAVVPPNGLPDTRAALRDAFEAVLADEAPGAPGAAGEAWLDLRELPSAEARPVARLEGCLELCTSGSSGEPRRVPKDLAQLAAEVETLEACFGARAAGALVLGTVPHHHIYGLLFRLLWPLCAGRVWQAEASSDPERLGRDLESADALLLVGSPAHLGRLHRLLDLAPHRERLREVFCSGGPLAAEDAEAYRRVIGEAPLEVYGSTETGGIAWRRRGPEDPEGTWTPFPGSTVDRDDAGALRVVSPNTGGLPVALPDAVDFLPDGRFRLRGRLDRVVKLEEKRVSLPEVEACLRAHPLVRDAAVAVLQGHRAFLGAVVVPAPGVAGDRALREALRAHLARRFDPVALPRRWRFPAALPFDARGKLPAQALRALLEEAP